MGSITKLSGNRRKPYVARVSILDDVTGRMKRVPLGTFATQQEAAAVLADYIEEPTTGFNMTLGQLYSAWTVRLKKRNLSKQSLDGYKASWNYLSHLEKLPVRKIRTNDFQSALDDTITRYGTPLSYSAYSKAKSLCTQLMDFAMEQDIVKKNYANYIIIDADAQNEKNKFSDTEVKLVEKSVGKVTGADAILVLIYTGFRLNEFCILNRFSYEPEIRFLNSGSKTEAGRNRRIPVHSKIQPIVEGWYAKATDALYPTPAGAQYRPDTFRRDVFYPALEKMGIVIENEQRKLTPHCTRHTFPSIAHKAGADMLVVQRLLGHKKFEQTAYYTHEDDEERRRAIECM